MHCIETRTILVGVQVVVSYYHGAGVTLMQFFEQPSHGLLLCLSARVSGLTADVQTTLIAYAYRVGVMVHAVGADHVFRTSQLYASVTTDDVVVADAIKPSVLMPLVDVCCR